jgi:hypothetical protein
VNGIYVFDCFEDRRRRRLRLRLGWLEMQMQVMGGMYKRLYGSKRIVIVFYDLVLSMRMSSL